MSFQTYQRFFCVGLYKIVGFMIEYVTMFAKKNMKFSFTFLKKRFHKQRMIIYIFTTM